MNKILFVVYGGGHARLIRPVILYLLSTQKNIEIICLALTTAVHEFSDLDFENFKLVGYKDFFSSDLGSVTYGEVLVEKLESVFDREESVCYLGRNYSELILRLGSERQAKSEYLRNGRQTFLPIESLKHIITVIKPDVVVTTNSPRSEKAALIAARELSVRSLAIIDMFSYRAEGWLVDYADTVCVFDQAVAERLKEVGRQGDIIITGNPAFDNLVRNFKEIKSALSVQKKQCQFTVLWASQREPEYVAELDAFGNVELPVAIERELINIFRDKKHWSLIVRNHPNEKPRSYPDFVKVSTQDEALEKLLARVHVIVTLTSTVGLQGRIMGCELITIDGSAFTPTVPFAKVGYSLGLASPSSLAGELERLARKIESEPLSVPPYCIENAAEQVAQAILSF